LSPYCGRTRVASAHAAAILSLLVLPFLAAPQAPGAFGLSSPALVASTSLSLGFGPTSLSPLSSGVPVYTVGEAIWAQSGYDTPVALSLTAPAGGHAGAPSLYLLEPHVITPLYTFASSDSDGIYNLTLAGSQGTVVIPVHFVNPSDHAVSLSALQYSLADGNISISAQADLGDSYDQEVCASGPEASAGVTLKLPASMGENGQLTLSPGNRFSVTMTGTARSSFSFWFELIHPYALEAPVGNSLLLNDLTVARSQPVNFVTAGTSNATILWNMPLREGRYDLRAYFQNATSLAVFQSRLLVVNASSWVSLSNACPPAAVQSSGISYSTSLQNGQGKWPDRFYLMYRTFGVEAVASYRVAANLSSVYFVSRPWGTLLHNFTVNVAPVPGVQTTQGGGQLFVLAQRYPVKLNYTLDLAGGQDVAGGSVTVGQSGTQLNSPIKLAQLAVHVISDQTAPATLTIDGPKGVKLTSALGANLTASFLLPAGSYTVTASQSDNVESTQVALTDGDATAVTLNFNTFMSLEIILIVTAIMAAAADVAVWLFSSRSLRAKLAAS
jgi:hypothetical protein